MSASKHLYRCNCEDVVAVEHVQSPLYEPCVCVCIYIHIYTLKELDITGYCIHTQLHMLHEDTRHHHKCTRTCVYVYVCVHVCTCEHLSIVDEGRMSA